MKTQVFYEDTLHEEPAPYMRVDSSEAREALDVGTVNLEGVEFDPTLLPLPKTRGGLRDLERGNPLSTPVVREAPESWGPLIELSERP